MKNINSKSEVEVEVEVLPFPIETWRKVSSNQGHQSHSVHMISNWLWTLYPIIDPSFPLCSLQQPMYTILIFLGFLGNQTESERTKANLKAMAQCEKINCRRGRANRSLGVLQTERSLGSGTVRSGVLGVGANWY